MDANDYIQAEIEKRHTSFAWDNLSEPTASDFLLIKNAMLIGASIATEANILIETAQLKTEPT